MTSQNKYRLITRHDFDGLVSAVLLKELEMIDAIEFAHPKDMQDGNVNVSNRDITTNLPHTEGAHLVFDHHLSEANRVSPKENHIFDPNAPSTAQVVYDHFGAGSAFPDYVQEMIAAVNKADSGQFTREEILNPRGWILLHFLLDPRTGLGRFRNFAKSNRALMLRLTDYCRKYPIERVMKLFDVTERSDRYFVLEEKFKEQIQSLATLNGKTLVIDLREQDIILAGNRFLPYVLFPESNISIHVIWGRERKKTVFAIGKSIFDRSSPYNIGVRMLQWGGGGHEAAGACQVPNERADEILEEIIQEISSTS